MTSVRLGFAVGTGEPVDVPIAHMVVTGQTQAAGKTTTLEALVQRSGVRALAFRTKRGEGAFETTGSRVAPYFRERADWRFVSALLEASLGERMKFERSWIMRAAKGARKLDDVRHNVRTLSAKAKGGMSADMFMMLGEYLDGVVPELQRVTFASRVDLRPGANVVDLSGLSVNVQGLVISSMLQWVHEREDGIVAVLPEAWKFLPQGRNSPVRMAAIAYAREGGALGNLIWLDSQDLAGAEKEVVRQASVYLLGVQREANEVKRTLDHIPAGVKKPKAGDVATLGKGQFYACWGERVVKTYVWPAWMTEEEARAIAAGSPQLTRPPTRVVAHGGKFENLDPRPLLATARTEKMPDRWPAPPTTEDTEEDDMTPAQEKKLDALVDAVTALTKVVGKPMTIHQKFDDTHPDKVARSVAAAAGSTPPAGTSEEDMYQRFVARLREEAPTLIRVMVERPEIEVEVMRQTIQVDGKTLRGKIAQLIAGGYFDAAKRNGDLKTELDRIGFNSAPANNLRELKVLAEMGFFTLEGDRFKAVPGMKVNVVER